MEIAELTDDEQLALVGLIEFVGESNANITDEEQDEISGLVGALGTERYRGLVEAVDRKFADEKALKSHLQTITRPEARELIFGLVLETTLSDPENLKNSQMIDWLRGTWNVSVEIGSD